MSISVFRARTKHKILLVKDYNIEDLGTKLRQKVGEM